MHFLNIPAGFRAFPFVWVVNLFLAFAMTTGLPSPAQAVGDSPLRSAAEIDYPPFSYLGPDGRATGFSVELLRAAMAAMGRDVTFQTGPWPEVRAWLENGELDALPLVGRTPEREILYDFTFPYMSLYGAIVVRKADIGKIWDLKDLEGRCVAVMKGDNAEEFLRREERGIQMVTTPTFVKAFRLLSEGGCDAVVIQRLVALRLLQETGLTGLAIVNRPIENFRQDFCFAVAEGDRDTLALLNEGLALVMADGTFRHLHAKWFAALELPAYRRLIFGGDYNFPPFEFLDENGKPSGFNVDITQAVARETGMNIEIRLGPWPEILADLGSGEIDGIQGMFYSPERDRIFDFTPAHIVNHNVAVVRKGRDAPADWKDLAGLDIVVEKGDNLHDFVVENGMGEHVSLVDTQEDALRELAEGKHDCALVARLTAFYWIEKYGWDHLKVGEQSLLSQEYCFSVANGNRALLSQISEGLKIIHESGEYRRIYEKWMGGYGSLTPDYLAVARYAAIVLAPLMILLLGFFLWNRSLRRQVAFHTKALRQSEEFQRAMIDCSPVALYSIDPQGRVLSWNATAERMFGWTAEEIMGKALPSVPEDRQSEMQNLQQRVLGGDIVLNLEVICQKKDGTRCDGSLSVTPIQDQNGRIIGIMGAMEDITNRKQAEKEKENLQAQLLQAQKLESVGRLAGGVAHGFNNMLSVILGYSELALEKIPSENPFYADIKEVMAAGQRAAEVTRQLLAFARRQTIAPKELDINETVERMLRMLRRVIGEDIELVWHPRPGLWAVHMDPIQIDQVLVNLCVNAKDAIAGGGKIIIETDRVSFDDAYCADHSGFVPGDFVMLAVTDDGCGMDAETLERIYEPFFTTKAVGEGTGLATAHGLWHHAAEQWFH